MLTFSKSAICIMTIIEQQLPECLTIFCGVISANWFMVSNENFNFNEAENLQSILLSVSKHDVIRLIVCQYSPLGTSAPVCAVGGLLITDGGADNTDPCII